MSEAKRRQQRILMLPHLASKFDVERFLRTGVVMEFGRYEPPDTPAMREAREAIDEERRMHEERLGHVIDHV